MHYEELFNTELIQAIKTEYADFIENYDKSDVEMLRDGALHQINEQWPELLEKLTLAPSGVSALETLLADGENILLKMLLMQVLTDTLQTFDENDDKQAEEDSAENKGE